MAREYRHATAAQAAAAILAAAAGLSRQDNYLHHLFALGPDGIVIIVAHGRLEKLGVLALKAGAQYALVIENGGSPQLGLRPTDGFFRPFLESYYFRQLSIAMLMTELVPEKFILEGRADLCGE